MERFNYILSLMMEILFLAVLLLMPFSYEEMGVKQSVFLLGAGLFVFFFLMINRGIPDKFSIIQAIIPATLIFIFLNYGSKSFVADTFFLSGNGIRISVSALILFLIVNIWILKVYFFREKLVPRNSFLRNWFVGSGMVMGFAILIFPVFSVHYQIGVDALTGLLVKIIQILLLLIVTISFYNKKETYFRFSIFFLLSFCVAVFLKFLA